MVNGSIFDFVNCNKGFFARREAANSDEPEAKGGETTSPPGPLSCEERGRRTGYRCGLAMPIRGCLVCVGATGRAPP